jgi:hypothetical protein
LRVADDFHGCFAVQYNDAHVQRIRDVQQVFRADRYAVRRSELVACAVVVKAVDYADSLGHIRVQNHDSVVAGIGYINQTVSVHAHILRRRKRVNTERRTRHTAPRHIRRGGEHHIFPKVVDI